MGSVVSIKKGYESWSKTRGPPKEEKDARRKRRIRRRDLGLEEAPESRAELYSSTESFPYTTSLPIYPPPEKREESRALSEHVVAISFFFVLFYFRSNFFLVSSFIWLLCKPP